MYRVYQFKVSSKYRKDKWCRIQIGENQTLYDFDQIIRTEFDHDLADHLSTFFRGKIWKSEDFGEIYPGGSGSGANKKLNQIGLSKGDKLGYIYDFGDCIERIIKLEKIVETEKGIEYPRLIYKTFKNDNTE